MVNDYSSILANIRKRVTLSSEEEERLVSIIKTSRIKKRQFVIQPGFPCIHRNYVVKGAFRAFFVDDDGKEHTLQIAVEDWFFSDFYSYITQTPATIFVEALEDSVIFQLEYKDIEKLCSEIHNLSEYFRLTTERAFAYSRMRVQSNLSKSAEQRYKDYLEKYPHIAQRVPQYVLASYLGISAEFLSKIRSGQVKKS